VKQKSLEKFENIIASIEFVSYYEDKEYEVYKCKLILQDSSNLRILERYKNNKLVNYSYYWLTSSNKLKIGWDRAPHHPHLKTFPYHKHLAGKKKPIEADERNLADVLAFIAKQLET
jgi:hypothetical protein